MCDFDSSKVTKSFNCFFMYFIISAEVCTCAAMETGTIFHCFDDP